MIADDFAEIARARRTLRGERDDVDAYPEIFIVAAERCISCGLVGEERALCVWCEE